MSRRLVADVFRYGDETYEFVVRVATLVAITATCLALGTFAIRLTVDDGFMALGFALIHDLPGTYPFTYPWQVRRTCRCVCHFSVGENERSTQDRE